MAKQRFITVLIDGHEEKMTQNGVVYRHVKGVMRPVSSHTLSMWLFNMGDNFKVKTNGHDYVLNYNPKTFKK